MNVLEHLALRGSQGAGIPSGFDGAFLADEQFRQRHFSSISVVQPDQVEEAILDFPGPDVPPPKGGAHAFTGRNHIEFEFVSFEVGLQRQGSKAVGGASVNQTLAHLGGGKSIGRNCGNEEGE